MKPYIRVTEDEKGNRVMDLMIGEVNPSTATVKGELVYRFTNPNEYADYLAQGVSSSRWWAAK